MASRQRYHYNEKRVLLVLLDFYVLNTILDTCMYVCRCFRATERTGNGGVVITLIERLAAVWFQLLY